MWATGRFYAWSRGELLAQGIDATTERGTVISQEWRCWLEHETWQVIGSAITVIVVVVLSARFLSPWLICCFTGVTYAAAWGYSSFARDDSGLAVIGFVMILMGVTVASLVVALIG